MSEAPTPDVDVVSRISLLLRLGVIVSTGLLLLGGGIYLVRHGAEPAPDRRQFKPQPAEHARPVEILAAVTSGRGRAIIQFALLLLIATPILRVIYSIVAFVRLRDWIYVLIPTFVLLVLMLGMAFARLKSN